MSANDEQVKDQHQQDDRDSCSDEDDVAMTDVEKEEPPASLIVTPGKAPRLLNLDPRHIIEFKDKYQFYVDALADAGKRPRAIKTMIDASLLDVLSENYIKKAKMELTNEDFLSFFDKQLKADTSTLSDMPGIIKKELKMNLDLRPKARVADLLVQLTNLSKRHNWSEAFAGTEGAKNKIRFLIGALQPPSLRTHMLGRVRFAKTTLQDDVDGFLHELSDCIEGFERDLLREQTWRPFMRPSTFPNLAQPWVLMLRNVKLQALV